MTDVDEWLRLLVERSGSDLFLLSGVPPTIRCDGELVPLDLPPLEAGAIVDAVSSRLAPHAARQYRESGVADASLSIPALGRFRVNLHSERGRPAAVIRALPTQPPRLATLNLPREVEALTRLRDGLVLVSGAAGSGKSTTLAALVEEINRRDARHIVTIEDPIEYEHPNRRSLVQQMEIGVDAPDFPTALRSVLRQSPDVIVVGEMRDPETMHIALSAAEAGHLVFATLHSTDGSSAVSRMADSFPSERQSFIRQEIAMGLAAILTQRLLPAQDGGRLPAAELLMVGFGARVHIRGNKLQHLHQEIALTRAAGSFSLEEALSRLVRDGRLALPEAHRAARYVEELDAILRLG